MRFAHMPPGRRSTPTLGDISMPPTSQPKVTPQQASSQSRWQLPRKLEQGMTWLCIACICSVATLLTFGLVEAVLNGQVKAFSKHGTGSLVLLSSQPVSFWTQVFIQAILASVAWLALIVSWNRTSRER